MRIVRNNEDKGSVFDKHFRELRNSEVSPAGDLWDRVEYKLDEDRQRVKHDHWYHALLLLLIPLTAVNVYLTYDLQGLYVSFFKKGATEQISNEAIFLGNNLPSQLYSTGGSSIPLSLHNPFAEIANTANNELLPNKYERNTSADAKSVFVNASNELLPDAHSSITQNSFQSDAIAANDLMPVERLLLETDATPQDVKFNHARNKLERKQSAIKGFHVGVEGGLNHSMVLINDSKLDQIIGGNIHRKLDLGAYYAVSMGYDFSRKFGVETELIFCSQQGQKYSELRYGKVHVDGEIDLEYMSVPVLFKYKMTKMGGKALNPRVINFVAGLQYSRLKEASIKMNNLDLQNATEPFNRDELGVVLGLEYDLFVSPNYFVTLGTRASISSDIHAFPYFVPQASQTYNVLVGVNASFHYLMKRKG